MSSRTVVLLLLVCVPMASTLGAEVLVLHGGSHVETQGPFEIEGRKVTFHDLQGRLRMLRLSEVDLEATREANAPAPEPVEPTEAEPAAPAKPILVLTNADIRTVSDDGADPQVSIYTTTWCIQCKRAKALLDELKVTYAEHDVELDTERAREAERKHPSCGGVPVIDIGGEMLCGFDAGRIRQAVDQLAERS